MTVCRYWPKAVVLAAVVGTLFTVHLGSSWALPAHLYLAVVGALLTVIDLQTKRLPDVLTLPSYPVAGALLGLASIAEDDPDRAWRALAAMAVVIAFYDLVARVNPAGMGYGDVKFSGVLGLYLGWSGWDAVVVGTFLAFAAGAVTGLVLLALRRARLASTIAFGPFMLAGAVLGILLGGDIGDWYRGE